MDLSPPRVTVSSDCFLKNRIAYGQGDDPFHLEQRLEPIFDMVRHKETAGPFNIAIYGGAGTGKTTALRWLKEKIEAWNLLDAEAREGHPQILPVWISARNLQEAQTVDSRLICDLLLSCLSLYGALNPGLRRECITQAVHLEGELAGTPFRQGLLSLTRAWGLPAKMTEGSMAGSLSCMELFQRYFNYCPKTGEGVRTILLIDDLDFVPPDVMMAVFTALDLHLIPFGLVSVTSFDADIGQFIVTRHFEKHGYDVHRSQLYLSKIFQAEVHIDFGRVHMDRYFDYEFDLLNHKIGDLLAAKLPDVYKASLRNTILHLAKMNPRMIKLLLNSALMTGYGAMRGSVGISERELGVTVAQGMQQYLLQCWLSSFSPEGGSVIYREDVVEWLDRLSQAVCEPGLRKQIFASGEEDGTHWGSSGSNLPFLQRVTERAPSPLGLSCPSIPVWIFELLTIPFSMNPVGGMVTVQPEAQVPSVPAPIKEVVEELLQASQALKEVLATELHMKVEDLVSDDLIRVLKMDLSRREMELNDWEMIGKMVNLETLNLHGTKVQDLRWITGLGKLKRLNLSCTSIIDIGSLAGLKTLEVLDLSSSPVTDLTPLRECAGLESLILYGTGVQELAPIGGLQQLSSLNLSHTKVTDPQIAVIELLPKLKTLFLRETDVSRERVVKLRERLGLRERIGYDVRIDF